MEIDSNILQIYRSMYETVKSCVRHGNNTYSDCFEISIGLRQGQTSSHAMLNDLELFLQNELDSWLTLYDIIMHHSSFICGWDGYCWEFSEWLTM